MRTKRKSTPETQAPTVDPPLTVANSEAHVGTRIGPVIVEGCKHLSPYDLARYELAQSRVVAANQALGLKILLTEKTKREAEAQLLKMQAEQDGIRTEMNLRQTALQELQTELAGLYGLDFQVVSYDDQSGKLYVQGEPVTE